VARKVDHDQRRRGIVDAAIRMFSQVGYENVSLIMIAAASAVSRTALYQYFSSKRQVMDAAILSVTDRIAESCSAILVERAPSADRLERVCHVVVDVMFANKSFLVAVFDFVIGMVRAQESMGGTIAKFTAGTRTAIRRLFVTGVAHGEFPKELDVDHTVDVFYSEFESCAMRIVLGTERTATAARARFTSLIRAFVRSGT